MSRFQRETPKRVTRAWNETARAWQAEPVVQSEASPAPPVRPIDPAERDRWRREIERRAAMVRGLSVEDAARKLYAEGLLGRAVLEVLGVEP